MKVKFILLGILFCIISLLTIYAISYTKVNTETIIYCYSSDQNKSGVCPGCELLPYSKAFEKYLESDRVASYDYEYFEGDTHHTHCIVKAKKGS